MAKKYTSRRRAAAQESEAPNRTLYYVIGGIAAVALLIVGALVYDSSTTPSVNPNTQFQTSAGRDHVEPGTPLTFTSYPPTSGAHYADSLAWGKYNETVDEGFWVHSMEHGGIVVLYNCELTDNCADLKAEAESFFDDAPFNSCPESRVIVMPYAQGMTTPLTVLAWQHRLDLEEYDYRQMVDFYRIHEENGPEVLPCGVNGSVNMNSQ